MVVPVSLVVRPYYFVTWEQETAAGDADVYVSASFDGGCTWCGPVLWSGTGANERRPRIAAGVTPLNQVGVHVVFEREGAGVWVSVDASVPVSSRSPPWPIRRSWRSTATRPRRRPV